MKTAGLGQRFFFGATALKEGRVGPVTGRGGATHQEPPMTQIEVPTRPRAPPSTSPSQLTLLSSLRTYSEDRSLVTRSAALMSPPRIGNTIAAGSSPL